MNAASGIYPMIRGAAVNLQSISDNIRSASSEFHWVMAHADEIRRLHGVFRLCLLLSYHVRARRSTISRIGLFALPMIRIPCHIYSFRRLQGQRLVVMERLVGMRPTNRLFGRV
jgi:hypothetical protein